MAKSNQIHICPSIRFSVISPGIAVHYDKEGVMKVIVLVIDVFDFCGSYAHMVGFYGIFSDDSCVHFCDDVAFISTRKPLKTTDTKKEPTRL